MTEPVTPPITPSRPGWAQRAWGWAFGPGRAAPTAGWLAWWLLVLGVALGVYRGVDEAFEADAQVLAEQQMLALSVAYEASGTAHRREIDALLRTEVLTSTVLRLWAQAQADTPQALPVWRGRLYRQLQPAYQRLEADGMRQLHLHWPDGRSLLRMHRPDRADDPLFDIRPSVRLANTRFQPVSGFEGGRVLPGFRQVRPVWGDGQHLGSVELSLPFEALHNEMSRLLPQAHIALLLQRRVASDRVFGPMASHFVPSGLSDDYVVENPEVSWVTRRYLQSTLATEVAAALAHHPRVRAGLVSQRSFTLPLLHGEQGVAASFHAVEDVEGLHAAYVVAYHPMPALVQLAHAKRQQALAALGGTLALGVAMGLVGWQWQRQRRQARQLSLITERMADGLYVMDEQGRAIYVNQAACDMLGYAPGELVGQPVHDTVHQHAHNRHLPLAQCPVHATTVQGMPFVGEEVFRRKDGSVFAADVRSMPMQTVAHERASVTLFRDLTAQRQSDARLRQAASVFEHAQEGICITDPQSRVVEVNEAFALITGYGRDEVLGRNPRLLSSGRQSPEFYQAMWGTLTRQGHWRGEVWNRHKSGSAYAALLTVTAVKSADGTLQSYVGILSDITSLKLHEAELERIALYDPLTRAANRRLLGERLDQALAQARRRGHRVALAALDLDGFKAVNDRHGHDAGDRLLVEVCRRLTLCLRQTDTLARVGGDEFVLLLTDLAPRDDTQWQDVVARVLHSVAQPVLDGADTLRVSCSVGVALFPDHDEPPETLLRLADQAMYQAKQSGKNRWALAQRSGVAAEAARADAAGGAV